MWSNKFEDLSRCLFASLSLLLFLRARSAIRVHKSAHHHLPSTRPIFSSVPKPYTLYSIFSMAIKKWRNKRRQQTKTITTHSITVDDKKTQRAAKTKKERRRRERATRPKIVRLAEEEAGERARYMGERNYNTMTKWYATENVKDYFVFFVK